MDEQHRGCGDGLCSLPIRLLVPLLRLDVGRVAVRGREGGPRPLGARSAWRSCLQLAHTVGEHPERTVEPHVLIDALDGTGALASALGITPVQTTLDQVFLDAIEGGPEVAAAVIEASGR